MTMLRFLVLLSILITISFAQQGYLNVQADQSGLKVYLEDELIGTTPIYRHPVEPGEYWVSLFPSDSSETRYNDLTGGDLATRLSALWYLARVQKGTVRVRIAAGETRDVFLSMRAVERAPCVAKWQAAGCASAPFALGVGIGILIMLLAGSR